VGDVGMLTKLYQADNINDVSIGGTQPQRIGSCLATLDQFLSRHECDSTPAVLSSFVLVESTHTASETPSASSAASLRQIVAYILGHFHHFLSLLRLMALWVGGVA